MNTAASIMTNQKRARAYFSFVLLFMMLIFRGTLYSYTWFVQGSWDYLYTVKKGGEFETGNAMNLQKKWGLLEGRTVMMNTVSFGKFTVKAPFPLQNTDLPDEYLTPAGADEKARESVKSLAASIVGDAKTLDVAVERIGHWVRNNVNYELGAPADPLKVIEEKKACRVGYGNVMAELLRSAGIPAKAMSCYVPRGCGWGFSSEGGYHAFAEYYYPGRGWFSCDPQNSINFTDPFHVLEWCYGSGSFLSEVARVDESYVVDLKDGPKNWETFFAPAWENPSRPAFVFRIIDREGKSGIGSPGLKYGTKKAMAHILAPDATDSGGTGNPFAGLKPGVKISTIYGFSADLDQGRSAVVKTSREATHVSVLSLDNAVKALRFKDRAHVSLGPCLYVKDYNFTGAGVYRFNADFSDETLVKKILLRDGGGGAMKNRNVIVGIGGGDYAVTSDVRGTVFCITDEKKCTVVLDGEKHHVEFSSAGIARVPEAPPRDDPVEKFCLSSGISEGPALVCEIRDGTDTPSRDSFHSIVLYGKTQLPRVLEGKAPGVVTATALVPGEEYFILFSDGNRHIKRKFIAHAKEAVKIAVSAAKENFNLLLSGEPPGTFRPLIYEYLDSGQILPLKAIAGRMLVSFPPGEYFISSNRDGSRLVPIKVTADSKSLVYDPETLSMDDYARVMDHLSNGKMYTAGCLVHGGERIRGADVWLHDTSTGAMLKTRTANDGFFHFSGVKEGISYRVFYFGDNFLISGQFTARAGKNMIVLDSSKIPARSVIPAQGKNNSSAVSKSPQKGTFNLLLPYWNGQLRFHVKNLANVKIPYGVFIESGSLLFSASGGIIDAVSVKSGGARADYVLAPGGNDPLRDRYEAIKDFLPKDVPALVARISGPAGAIIANARVRLVSKDETRYLDSDSCGILWADSLERGEKYILLFEGKGYRLEYPLLLEGGGLYRKDIVMKTLPRIALSVKNYDGSLYRSYPVRKGDQVYFNNESLSPDENTFTIFTPEGSVFFRIGKNRSLKEFKAGSHRVDCSVFSNNPLDEYGKIASLLFKNEPAVAMAISRNGSFMRDYSLKVTVGDSSKTVNAMDGIIFITGAVGKAEFNYSGSGYHYQNFMALKGGAVIIKAVDLVKETKLQLALSGVSAPGKQVVLYRDAVINNGKVVGSSGLIRAMADEKGSCRIVVPDGSYYLDCGKGDPVKVQVGGKQKLLKLSL